MTFTRIAFLITSLAWSSNLIGKETENWPQYRGPRASGVAAEEPTPTHWDVGKKKNILWKASIPGLGHSAPIIWGNRVYITTAVSEGKAKLRTGLYGDIGSVESKDVQRWRLFAFERHSGKLLFDRLVHQAVPKVKRHPKASHCNSTPATDGKSLVSIFGSQGLFCFDLQGKMIWKKDLGPMDSGYFRSPAAQWGFGSSPIIHRGRVVVLCDVQKNSFLACFDLANGKEVWRTPRKDVPGWTTPTIVQYKGQSQILVNGWRHSGAYDFENGKEIWKLKGGGDIPVPTPITAYGRAYLTSAHGGMRPMRAINLGANGDITPEEIENTSNEILWVHTRRGNYMQTPIVVGMNLYGCDDNGVLTCFDAKKGKIHYRERLGNGGGGYTASPVSDGRHLYFAGETGKVFVVPVSKKFSVLSSNDLGESCLATPAIAQGVLYFRTQHHLIAIGERK